MTEKSKQPDVIDKLIQAADQVLAAPKHASEPKPSPRLRRALDNLRMAVEAAKKNHAT